MWLMTSPGEREQQRLILDYHGRSGFADRLRTILPLPPPKGEGRGEGKCPFRFGNNPRPPTLRFPPRRTSQWGQRSDPSNCARYSVGDWPRIFLNTRLKWVSDWKPTSKAISLTRRFGIEQEVFGLLDAHAREVIGEVDAGHLLEHLAEIERAGVDGLGDVAEAEVLGLVLLDELLGPGDDGRLGVARAGRQPGCSASRDAGRKCSAV